MDEEESPPVSHGFTASCPECREVDALKVDLYDLREVKCVACDSTFTPEECRDRAKAELAQWEAICRWIERGREIARAIGEGRP